MVVQKAHIAPQPQVAVNVVPALVLMSEEDRSPAAVIDIADVVAVPEADSSVVVVQDATSMLFELRVTVQGAKQKN